MARALGIDVGSVATKVVVLSADQPLSWFEEPTRPDIAAHCEALLRRAGAVDSICATGYGRNLLEQTELHINEIIADALGAGWMQKRWSRLEHFFDAPPEPRRLGEGARTIVDIGGQDTKVITLDKDGLIRDFAMNDRCAAGTGRFLEVMASALEVDVGGLGRLAVGTERAAPISSTCTVFAESEVVSLLAEGAQAAEVAAGVFESIAEQSAGLAERCVWAPPVLLVGGPSRSTALQGALARRFGCELLVPPLGQYAAAIGAALAAANPNLSRRLTHG